MKRQTFDLSRRKILAGIGSIGIASAGAGLGTSAYFSDEETYENNQLVAGELDMYVAFEEHYSDWSDDEVEGLEGDVVMEDGTDLSDESRVGLPSNAAPMISVRDAADANQFLDNTLDTAYPEGYDAGTELDDPCGDESPLQDGTERHPAAIDLDDVKPGDFGEVTFSFALCDNPGYVWATGGLVSKDENGLTEPERKDPDEEEGVVELLDVVRAAVWVDDGNNFQNGGEEPILAGRLRDVLETLDDGAGVPLDPLDETEDRNCFVAETVQNVVFAWWVPIDHGNEIQSDSVTFDLGFYTEQCRHNDGSGMTETVDLSTGTANWQVVNSPDGTTGPAQITDPHPNYATTGCASWIDPYGNSPTDADPAGEYVYELEFTVEGSSPVDTLSIGPYGSDNPVEFFLDGTKIGGSDGDSVFSSFRSDIDPIEDLAPGTHVLRAEVQNGGGPTALLVCGYLE
jgi:predicted ribosomally synthesized peptide with SipW-like signal peptide